MRLTAMPVFSSEQLVHRVVGVVVPRRVDVHLSRRSGRASDGEESGKTVENLEHDPATVARWLILSLNNAMQQEPTRGGSSRYHAAVPDPSPEPPTEDFVARYRREERDTKMRQSATGVGIEFATTVAMTCLLGWGFDAWRDTSPIGLLVGLFVGLGVAFYRLVLVANGMTKANIKKKGDA